jgi:tetratricopeptide (TPR) repeat protein
MKNNPKRAIDDYAEALKLDSSNPTWWNACGKLRTDIKDLDHAVKDLTKATELNPKYKQAWLNLGSAYFFQDKYAKAAEALLQAVAIDANDAKAHQRLSVVFRKLNDHTKANKHEKLANDLQN